MKCKNCKEETLPCVKNCQNCGEPKTEKIVKVYSGLHYLATAKFRCDSH